MNPDKAMPTDPDNLIHGSMSKDFRRVGTLTADPDNARLADEPCEHDWYYTGTDYHGSHKGEDHYHCRKCPSWKYELDGAITSLVERPVRQQVRAVAVEQDTEEIPEVAAMRYIEQLRADEGDSVTILCNNPEAETNDRLLAVECNGAWTDWQDRRFYGESVLQCLAKAIYTRATLAVESTEPSNSSV